MRKRVLFLFIIIIISSLIMLTCHVFVHHQYGNDDEFHCPFCALLNTGFVSFEPFKLFVCFAIFMTIFFNAEINKNVAKIFNNQLRAPPFLFFIEQTF
jgi:hypothetical protein